jgi:hypothetical protein
MSLIPAKDCPGKAASTRPVTYTPVASAVIALTMSKTPVPNWRVQT